MPKMQNPLLEPSQGRTGKDNPRHRKVLVDKYTPTMIRLYNDGYSVNYIAATVGCTFTAVKKRLLRVGIKFEMRRPSGRNHHRWKGGKYRSDGYFLVKNPDYLKSGEYYIRRSRLVWQQANGPIPEGYEVHHLNGKKDDDRLENFCLLNKRTHGKNIPLRAFIKRLQAKIRELETEVKDIKAQRNLL